MEIKFQSVLSLKTDFQRRPKEQGEVKQTGLKRKPGGKPSNVHTQSHPAAAAAAARL